MQQRTSQTESFFLLQTKDLKISERNIMMDLTFAFTAVVFTLLAIVVATTLLSRSSTSVDDTDSSVAQSGQVERTLKQTGLLGNGAQKSKRYTKTQKLECPLAEKRTGRVAEADIRQEGTPTQLEFSARKTHVERSSHAIPSTVQEMAPGKHCSTSCLAADKLPRFISKERPSNLDSSLEDLSGRGHGFMGLSEKELLKCAFSDRQIDETIPRNGDVDIHESDLNSTSLKYMPGMLRAKQMEKLMTREEMEEEQRVQREQLTAIFQLLRENQDTFGEVSEGEVQEQLKLYSI